MKPTDINDVPGEKLIDKIQALINQYGRLHVQEKINGIGFRATLVDEKLVLYTTRDKVWRPGFFSPLEIELSMFLAGNPGVAYGEFFVKGMALADFGGAISVNRKTMKDPRMPLQAIVYDVFDDNRPKAFSSRFTQIVWNGNYPVRLATGGVSDEAAKLVDLFNNVVAEGGEGIILRADPCYVGPGISPQMWKVKRIRDMEGRCFGVTEGLGKRKGMLGAFVVRLANGQSVSVGGGKGLTDEQLTHFYKNPPIGKMITFSYEEMSAYGIPLRCQFIAVRDYE